MRVDFLRPHLSNEMLNLFAFLFVHIYFGNITKIRDMSEFNLKKVPRSFHTISKTNFWKRCRIS